MTDCSSKIVSWWKDLPFFKPYLAEGIVEFYTFDMLDTLDAMKTLDSRTEVEMKIPFLSSITQPPVILFNQVLSCLPQDVISISSEGIASSNLTLYSSQIESDKTNPALLSRLSYESHCRVEEVG